MNIKKHIPNILTLCNLLCGCIALLEILVNKSVTGACILMACSLVFDFFDGFIARILKVASPIGRELDSLADMVTFGVLPATFINYIMLNYAHVSREYALFAFMITLFSALRLAKFNIDTRQSDSFIGLNTPANSILIASVALNLENFSTDILTLHFTNQYFLFGFVIVSSLALVAEIPMFAFKFKNFSWKGNEIRFGFNLSRVFNVSKSKNNLWNIKFCKLGAFLSVFFPPIPVLNFNPSEKAKFCK